MYGCLFFVIAYATHGSRIWKFEYFSLRRSRYLNDLWLGGRVQQLYSARVRVARLEIYNACFRFDTYRTVRKPTIWSKKKTKKNTKYTKKNRTKNTTKNNLQNAFSRALKKKKKRTICRFAVFAIVLVGRSVHYIARHNHFRSPAIVALRSVKQHVLWHGYFIIQNNMILHVCMETMRQITTTIPLLIPRTLMIIYENYFRQKNSGKTCCNISVVVSV